MTDDLLTGLDRLGKTIQNVFLFNERDNQDPVIALKAAIVCTNTQDKYSAGFRNGIRYAIAVLTGEAPKYEKVT